MYGTFILDIWTVFILSCYDLQQCTLGIQISSTINSI